MTNLSSPPPGSMAMVSRSLGAILIDSGRLRPQDAAKVLALQKEAGLLFGDAALRLGLVTEADISHALAHQYEYPCLAAGDDRVASEVVAAFQPRLAIVEQLRILRSQLKLRWLDTEAGKRMLAIVSPDSGEGRSFVAANLAVVFSQLGERTLLVDADLRRPRQHDIFRCERGGGLSMLLSGRCREEQAVIPLTCLPGLFLLPAGAPPPNPQELLCRPVFADLLRRVQADFDVVIFDTSAAQGVSDALAVAVGAGAALVVGRRDVSSAPHLRKVVVDMQQTGVNVLGSVLNAG